MKQVQGFIQTSSISNKLMAAVTLLAVLLLLQFVGTLLSSQSNLTGLAELHREQQLYNTVSRQRRITDSLIEIPEKPGLQVLDAERLFGRVYPQAEAAIQDAKRYAAGNSDFTSPLKEIENSIRELSRTASLYFHSHDATEASRHLLEARQFALEATEAEDSLQLVVERDSNLLFGSVYRSRYRSLFVALSLAIFFSSLVLLSGAKFIRHLSASIANLIQATRQVSMGNLEFQALVLNHDEIGALTTAFNQMIYRLRDTTVSREHFEALAEKNSKLYQEAQEAIMARDEFLSIASHELKTPLTSLSLSLQALVRMVRKYVDVKDSRGEPGRGPDLAQLLKVLSSSEAQCKRLASLLDDLLDLTRIRLGQLNLLREPTDLSVLVRDVIDRFRAEAAEKKIKITFQSPESLIGEWDPMRLEQVISNLVSNAMKYGNGSPISIVMERDRTGEGVKLVVSDRGPGIPSEKLGQLFERFERAGVSLRKFSGLGLGLYICRQIVQAHGGSIWVESKLGNGASFTVELPLRIAKAA